MEQLKKLKYYKYCYQVKILIKDLPNNIDLFRISNDNYYLTGYTTKKGIKILDNLKINYELKNLKKHYLKVFLVRKWMSIVSIIIILILMFLSNSLIRKIEFVDKYSYDYDVYEYVKSSLRKVGNCYLLKEDINSFNYSLRQKFNYYEFINVTKENGNLIIKIVKNDSNIKNDQKSYSSLIASKNAYVVKIEIENGISNINLFQMVKANDLLVSGTNVKAKIIGRCIEIKDLQLPKKINKKVYSSNYYTTRYIKNNKKKKEINIPFSQYYKNTNVLYEIGNFSLVEETYFEILDEEIIYTKEEIKSYSENYLKYMFYMNHHIKDERILDIKIVNVKEDESYFYIKALITSLEQIAIGKE